jgi:hypothetical protein
MLIGYDVTNFGGGGGEPFDHIRGNIKSLGQGVTTLSIIPQMYLMTWTYSPDWVIHDVCEFSFDTTLDRWSYMMIYSMSIPQSSTFKNDGPVFFRIQ